MSNTIQLVILNENNLVDELNEQLKIRNIKRDKDYFMQCLEDTRLGKRISVIALYNNEIAGYGHLIFSSNYPSFKYERIPEINDLLVFKDYQKRGIATKIILQLEQYAVEKGLDTVGIGVGLYRDYGNAQRLYVKLGFIPDGNGIQYHDKLVEPGSKVCVDDDLVLYFTKKLSSESE